jgi:hypothetical protein
MHRVECTLKVGDFVFLRLHPYRHFSMKKSGAEKIKPWFYELYRVTRRVCEVAYEMEIPEGSNIHNLFHISCLKKASGQHITTLDGNPMRNFQGLDLVVLAGHFEEETIHIYSLSSIK